MLNLAPSFFFFTSAPEGSEQEAEDELKTLLSNAHIHWVHIYTHTHVHTHAHVSFILIHKF